jgi:hypothetical protein
MFFWALKAAVDQAQGTLCGDGLPLEEKQDIGIDATWSTISSWHCLAGATFAINSRHQAGARASSTVIHPASGVGNCFSVVAPSLDLNIARMTCRDRPREIRSKHKADRI